MCQVMCDDVHVANYIDMLLLALLVALSIHYKAREMGGKRELSMCPSDLFVI